MSEQNKAVLKEANAAITEGDYEGFLSHCTDDTRWIFVGDQTLDGKEAVRKWMASAYLEPPKFNIVDLIAEGDFVTAIGEITANDESGKPVPHTYCDVWRFRDGKMAELRAFVIAT
jgi:ketosteroid isomerase-like protein